MPATAETYSVENREAVDDLIRVAEVALETVKESGNGFIAQWLAEAISRAKKGRAR